MRSIPLELLVSLLCGVTVFAPLTKPAGAASQASDANAAASTAESDASSPKRASSAADSPVQASVAPPETREVLAEGRAAIGSGGVDSARKVAIGMALRAAVEKATGVYVSARTLTRNYQLVRDQVVTHADGFATPEAVLREVDGPQEVVVDLRATVSLRPLALQLKQLNLTRSWRVRVALDDPAAPTGAPTGRGDASAEEVTTELEKALSDAGLVVVSSEDEADIVARISRSADYVSGGGAFTGSRSYGQTIRGAVTVRATLAQTGEVVASLRATGTASQANSTAARADAIGNAAAALAPRLTDALILLPARDSLPIELLVGRIGSATRAARFESALNGLPGVSAVLRRRYESGSGIWELQVMSDVQSEVARELEEDPALKGFKLKVISDTGVKIVAGVNGAPPVFGNKPTPEAYPLPTAAVAEAGHASQHTATLPLGRATPTVRVNAIDGATMVWIPAGSFTMGDNDPAIVDHVSHVANNPRHSVYLPGYYISRDLVTVAQYKKFCAATGHQMPAPPPWGWRENHPMVNVTWADALAYCQWADVRLPTEAEWEKAARGSEGLLFPWGNHFEEGRLRPGAGDDPAANVLRSSVTTLTGTVPVDSLTGDTSPFGVHDMAGDVWQWCSDFYQSSTTTSIRTSAFGPGVHTARVVRGGSWADIDAATFRTAFRTRTDPASRNDNIGFRTVSEPW